MSTLLSWLIAGIKLLVQIIVITWTTLAIYFSNLPWPALRLGLAVAFAAFAIWAFWVSRQRRMPAVAIALVLGVVAWSPLSLSRPMSALPPIADMKALQVDVR